MKMTCSSSHMKVLEELCPEDQSPESSLDTRTEWEKRCMQRLPGGCWVGDSLGYLGDVIATVNGDLPCRHCCTEQELLCSWLGFLCEFGLHFLGEKQAGE